jgi:hypothetical protein
MYMALWLTCQQVPMRTLMSRSFHISALGNESCMDYHTVAACVNYGATQDVLKPWS